MDRLWRPLLNRTLEAVPLRSRQRRLRVVFRRSRKGTPPLMQSFQIRYRHTYPFQEITIIGADSRIECCVRFSFILPHLPNSPQLAQSTGLCYCAGHSNLLQPPKSPQLAQSAGLCYCAGHSNLLQPPNSPQDHIVN